MYRYTSIDLDLLENKLCHDEFILCLRMINSQTNYGKVSIRIKLGLLKLPTII